MLELNNNSINPINQNHRKNARENSILMLKLCKKYNVQIIISSDAHIDTDVGRFNLAYKILNEVDFPEELIINNSVIDFKKKIRLNRV